MRRLIYAECPSPPQLEIFSVYFSISSHMNTFINARPFDFVRIWLFVIMTTILRFLFLFTFITTLGTYDHDSKRLLAYLHASKFYLRSLSKYKLCNFPKCDPTLFPI